MRGPPRDGELHARQVPSPAKTLVLRPRGQSQPTPLTPTTRYLSSSRALRMLSFRWPLTCSTMW